MKSYACLAVVLLSGLTGLAAAETTAPAAPAEAQVTGEPFKDAVLKFETAFAESSAAFSAPKPDLRICTKLSEQLDKTATEIVKMHEDRLRQYGLEFHNKLELLEINAHRLKIAVLERTPDDVVKYWNQLVLVRNIVAGTKAWK
jgi:hypothetical protein